MYQKPPNVYRLVYLVKCLMYQHNVVSQDGVVSCNGVRLDTDLIPSLKEGSVVMMLPGKDFTMEVGYDNV